MSHQACRGLVVLLMTVLMRSLAFAAPVVPDGPFLGPFQAPNGDDGPPDALRDSLTPLAPLIPSVRYRFPLLSNYWWHTVNYVDLDPSPAILDWGCHAVSYDGHHGHDIILRDFVEMDEGRFAVAAAPGTVVQVEDGNFDRNVSNPSVPANDVVVQHADGSYALYWHFRKWSTLVYTGQAILEGQPLGLIGSSGSSTDPHLHFETQFSGTVEPSTGACNPGVSLWKSQLPNVYLNAPVMYDYGETTRSLDGDFLKERPSNVTHMRQSGSTVTQYIWYKISDLHVGDTSRVVWLAPGGATYSDTGDYPSTNDYSYAWYYWTVNLPTSGSTGTWTVRLYLNGVLTGTLNFNYNTSFSSNPVATGRAVAVPKGTAKGRLNGSDNDSDIFSFSLFSNPAHGEVKLSGPRGRYFSYVPESGYSGPDTWQFRVQDGSGINSPAATMTMNVSPVLENSLRLEGEDDYVSVPASPSLDLASFTLEAWIRRTTGSTGWQGIIDRRHLFNAYGYALLLQPDSRLTVIAGDGANAYSAVGSSRIPLDRWVHVAATYAGGTLKLYVDDTLDGSSAFPGPISYAGVGELRIGASFIAGESFRGEIEEARVWNAARDATQLAQGGTCGFFDAALPASVAGQWRFQGNANDSSPNANHGTRVAGASFRRTDSALPLSCLVQNLDGDSLVDGLDNCPLDANDAQTNSDGDGVGDLCDPCPNNPLPSQVDSDGDGVGDRCDNCLFFGNTEQVDADGDGAGDLCDPAPANVAVSVPSDQITLSLAHDKSTGITEVSWTAGAFAASYEVYRGSRSDLQVRFYGTCQNSRDGSTTDTAFAENEAPSAGTAFYFLVVGVGSDGTRGPAGVERDGRQRDLRAKDCS